MTITMRTLSELAYERGEDFDAQQFQPSEELLEAIAFSELAGRPVEAPSPYERRRLRERERRAELAYVPDWFDAADFDHGPVGIHGELV